MGDDNNGDGFSDIFIDKNDKIGSSKVDWIFNYYKELGYVLSAAEDESATNGPFDVTSYSKHSLLGERFW